MARRSSVSSGAWPMVPARGFSEERPARVRRELGIADPASPLGFAEGVTSNETVGIRDLSVGKGKPVQHGQAVEPVIVRAVANLELTRPGSQQSAVQPRRHIATDRQGIDLGLAVE